MRQKTGWRAGRFVASVIVAIQVFISFGQEHAAAWNRVISLPGFDAIESSFISSFQNRPIIGGTALDKNGQAHFFATKYSPSGEQLWASAMVCPRVSAFTPEAMAVDGRGNVILTGPSETLKLDESGQLVWSMPFGGQSVAGSADKVIITGLASPIYSRIEIESQRPKQIDLILDCDPGFDPDDISDLALVHNLVTRGEVNLLAVMGSNPAPYAGLCLEFANQYFGRTNILVGVATNGITPVNGFGTVMANEYLASGGSRTNALNATALYRRILAARPDHSVTIVFGGQLRNLLNVYNSKPDEWSSLDGSRLLEKKLKRAMVVAGFYPQSQPTWGEYNLASDVESSLVLNTITNLPITYMPIQIGDSIVIPSGGIQQLPPGHPARRAHEVGGFTARPSWTGMALLYAVRGLSWDGTNFFTSYRGRNHVFENGANTFDLDDMGSQEYFWGIRPVTEYIDILTELLLQPRPPTNHPVSGVDFVARGPFDTQTSGPEPLTVFDFNQLLVSRTIATTNQDGLREVQFQVTASNWAGSTPKFPDFGGATLRMIAADANGNSWLLGEDGGFPQLFHFDSSGQALWSNRWAERSVPIGINLDPGQSSKIARFFSQKAVITKFSSAGQPIQTNEFDLLPYGNLALTGYTQDARGNPIFCGIQVGSAQEKRGFVIQYLNLPSAEILDNGTARLRFGAPAGTNVTIQATDSFQTWETIGSSRADESGVVLFDDPVAAQWPTRFYRIVY